MELKDKVKANEQQIIQWRRDLHQIPEVGLHLPKTAAYVTGELKKMGIPYRENVGGSGIVALIEGETPGKTIALRADMDALSIKEETDLAYASATDNMHACGHDAHTAMLLGAAKVLKDNKHLLKGNVKLLFQAAEEGPGGAKPMLEEGAFENPKVNAVLGLHAGAVGGNIGNGQVGVCFGKMMAAMDRFVVNVKGKGCHGAYPEKGVDPIVMAAQMIGSLQTLVSREVQATEPAVVTVGKIHGGSAFNIIPDEIEFEGTVRSTDDKVRKWLAKRIGELTQSIAQGMRGEVEYEFFYGYPPLVNDSDFTRGFLVSAKKVVGEEDVVEVKTPVMGGEDMAYFLEQVPGTYFFLGSIMEQEGVQYPHHNSRFMLDESVFVTGTALLVQGAVDWLENNCSTL
jgi:amidohydrolase